VPSPIIAICQGLAWSKPADERGEACLEIEVTLKSSWFDFIPAIDIHAERRRAVPVKACSSAEADIFIAALKPH
jgi:hypothetical protein